MVDAPIISNIYLMSTPSNSLLKDIDRSPFTGEGKPEPLKHNKQGYWSRRIDEINRIVYKVERDQLIIAQCGGHYDD